MSIDSIPEGWMGLDIGPKTLADIQAGLADCKTGMGRRWVLHSTAMYCSALHFNLLPFTTAHCIALHSVKWWKMMLSSGSRGRGCRIHGHPSSNPLLLSTTSYLYFRHYGCINLQTYYSSPSLPYFGGLSSVILTPFLPIIPPTSLSYLPLINALPPYLPTYFPFYSSTSFPPSYSLTLALTLPPNPLIL